MDDLSRIESIYGSVAEYNRVRFEENRETVELTSEEKLDGACKMAVYNEKLRLLSGEPSNFIKELVQEWNDRVPKESDFANRNEFIYAGYAYSTNKTKDIVGKICGYYHVKCDEEWATFYRPGLGQFAISVEYKESSQIYSFHIGGFLHLLLRI